MLTQISTLTPTLCNAVSGPLDNRIKNSVVDVTPFGGKNTFVDAFDAIAYLVCS